MLLTANVVDNKMFVFSSPDLFGLQWDDAQESERVQLAMHWVQGMHYLWNLGEWRKSHCSSLRIELKRP